MSSPSKGQQNRVGRECKRILCSWLLSNETVIRSGGSWESEVNVEVELS